MSASPAISARASGGHVVLEVSGFEFLLPMDDAVAAMRAIEEMSTVLASGDKTLPSALSQALRVALAPVGDAGPVFADVFSDVEAQDAIAAFLRVLGSREQWASAFAASPLHALRALSPAGLLRLALRLGLENPMRAAMSYCGATSSTLSPSWCRGAPFLPDTPAWAFLWIHLGDAAFTRENMDAVSEASGGDMVAAGELGARMLHPLDAQDTSSFFARMSWFMRCPGWRDCLAPLTRPLSFGVLALSTPLPMRLPRDGRRGWPSIALHPDVRASLEALRVVAGVRSMELWRGFPALAVALGAALLDGDGAQPLSALLAGARERSVAEMVGLPPWSKRVPCPSDEAASLFRGVRVFGLMPAKSIGALPPLDRLRVAALWSDREREALAPRALDEHGALVWLLENFVEITGLGWADGEIAGVLDWVSFALRRPADVARLHLRPFSRTMRPSSALEATVAWHAALVRDGGATDGLVFPLPGWADGLFSALPEGFSVTRLCSGAELRAEGERMHHCVASYARACLSGECAIYSVSVSSPFPEIWRGTIELRESLRGVRLVQARGVCNASAPPQVLCALREACEARK